VSAAHCPIREILDKEKKVSIHNGPLLLIYIPSESVDYVYEIIMLNLSTFLSIDCTKYSEGDD